MSTEHGHTDPGRLVPDEADCCVWMTAGLVAYKLCDRGSDCERCPFDAAMRGGTEVPRLPARGTGPLPRPGAGGWTFPADCAYHPAHTWARAVAADRVRVGLDGFGAHLTGRPSTIILPPVGSPVERGKAACWLGDGFEPIPLLSPVTGTVCACNEALRVRPEAVEEDPYGGGWLIEVRHEGADGLSGLLGPDKVRERSDAQLRELRSRLDRQLARVAPEVGPTMHDGGEPLEDLRRILGPQKYRRLILPFLS